MQDQRSVGSPSGGQRLRRFVALNIRSKIILPYLILTVVVAMIGVYVVTTLVASSLDERLTHHLLEAARVVSDSMASQELDHLESARFVAFTRGLAEALSGRDHDQVVALAQPATIGLGVECAVIVDADGRQTMHVLRQEDGSYLLLDGQIDLSQLSIVRDLLALGDPNALPRRGFGLHPAAQQYYYFTAIPVALESRVVGAVVVGTSVDTMLSRFQSTSLADVTLHLQDGRAVATTFAFPDQPQEESALLDRLLVSPALYERILSNTEVTQGENIEVRGRWYRLAHAPLCVGNNKLGVFSVALPAHFVVKAGTTSRNTWVLLFTLAMGGVVLIGYFVSRLITNPLGRLVRTSQAVAEGDLQQRTGIDSADEIGTLAETFDGMTARLSERTYALEETLGRMQAILASIGDGVLLEDVEGSFIPLNDTAQRLLEEMADNFMLGPLRELSGLDEEREQDERRNPWLLEHRRFQVGQKVISAHSAEVRADDGGRLGTVIVLRDVSAEVEAEQLKDAFVTHVSHELRTPLTAIKGYSALLLASAGDALNEEQRGFLRTINRHTDNLVDMINALLDFSEMEAGGKLGLRRHPVDLSTLVEEIASEWRPRMVDKGLSFQVEIGEGLPAVDVDTRRLRWAIINLVRNALQYTPADGEVRLRLSSSDGQVVLDVQDTGSGISAEDQKRLFSRFYRVVQIQNQEVRGLGLGLYVTKAIVDAHGGEVRVVSDEGAGSTFSVVLPAVKRRPPGPTGGADSGARN